MKLKSLHDLSARAGRRLADVVAPLLRKIEARDAVFGIGFTIAWYGGYHVSKPWSFVGAGIASMLIALLLMKSSTEDE